MSKPKQNFSHITRIFIKESDTQIIFGPELDLYKRFEKSEPEILHDNSILCFAKVSAEELFNHRAIRSYLITVTKECFDDDFFSKTKIKRKFK
jgi:hypothetical protein